MTALRDRVALVTGSSSGLGFAAARALLELGARVALNSRGGPKLDAAHRALAAGGGEVVAIPADIRQPDELEDLVKAGYLDEVPEPSIGFGFLYDGRFRYRSFGSSFMPFETSWIGCFERARMPSKQ